MTEFELRQTKKIVVHDLTKMNVEQFTTMILNNHRDNAIWTEGILMYILPMPTTDAMIESVRDGKEEHILAVVWAYHDVYKKEVQGIGGMKVGVTHGVSTMLADLAIWIKEQDHD